MDGYPRNHSLSNVLCAAADNCNDGDSTHSMKDEVKPLLLDFLDEAPDSPRYTRGGAYATYTFGGTAASLSSSTTDAKTASVRVILLDNRYFTTARGVEPADLLGDEQWQWLRRTLEENTSDLVIIGSGIQMGMQGR